MSRLLDSTQMESWRELGFLHLPELLSGEEKKNLLTWTDEISKLEETPGKWMQYFEKTKDNQRQLCRVENFIPYHTGIADLLQSKILMGVLDLLMGEKAVLFKEKINFKYPGGAGFSPHQDAPAFVSFNQTFHITMMLAVDDSTIENGCLEMGLGHHELSTLEQNQDGTMSPQEVEKLNWTPIEVKSGDVLLFHSYVPHRSSENKSQKSRRAYFVTYNKESEGSFREQYFEQKRKDFPPEIERIPGIDYSKKEAIFNLGNPIK